MFILTGSQQLGVLAGVTQTLAGRSALLPLLGFTLGELQAADRAPVSLAELLFSGLYPPVHDRRLDPATWYGNYVQTYIERDVRLMINVRNLGSLRTFVRMCAARCGQLLNLSSLGNDCAITHNTAKAWLSVLEASSPRRQLLLCTGIIAAAQARPLDAFATPSQPARRRSSN